MSYQLMNNIFSPEWHLTRSEPHLAYRCVFKQSGLPWILFVHGGPGDNSAYFKFSCGDELEENFNLIWFDQRGCGNSQRQIEASEYSVIKFAEDIGRIQQEVDVGKIIILAHSWGAIPAGLYAAKYPDRVSALINICGSASYLDSKTRLLNYLCKNYAKDSTEFKDLEEISKMPHGFFKLVRMYRYARKAGLYYKNYSKTKMEIARNNDLAVRCGEYSSDTIKEAEDPLYFLCLYDSLATFQIYDVLQKIKCPTLVVAGEYDKVADVGSLKKYADSIGGSEFVVFSQSGHHPFQEEKESFVATIKQFVEKIRYEKIYAK